jgi:hypothetical protein
MRPRSSSDESVGRVIRGVKYSLSSNYRKILDGESKWPRLETWLLQAIPGSVKPRSPALGNNLEVSQPAGTPDFRLYINFDPLLTLLTVDFPKDILRRLTTLSAGLGVLDRLDTGVG